MKKLILFIIIGLFLVLSAAGHAQEAVVSSGLSTTDRLIATGNCYIYGLEIVSGASTATVSIYDSTTISGTTVLHGSAGLATLWNGARLNNPVEVHTGIYADITGTGGAYTVLYKCK